MIYGQGITRTDSTPERSVIEAPELSAAGNTILRVGRENPGGSGWHQTEHVVLTPEESVALALEMRPLTDEERQYITDAMDAFEENLAAEPEDWDGRKWGPDEERVSESIAQKLRLAHGSTMPKD